MRRSFVTIGKTLVAFVLCVVATSGCIELQRLIFGDPPPGNGNANMNDNGNQNGNGNNNGNDNSDPDRPVVRLDASNISPLPDEEVVLTCVLLEGDAMRATFSFESTTPRLIENGDNTASFIVDAADVGQAFDFSCRAVTPAGISAQSTVTVIPVTAEPPFPLPDVSSETS